MRKVFWRVLLSTCFIIACSSSNIQSQGGVWISKEEIAKLPKSGPAWEKMFKMALKPANKPDVSDQEDRTNVIAMAKALVYAKTGEEKYRAEVIESCMAAIHTEDGGRTLALGRNLIGFVIAADLVGLPPEKDKKFRKWLKEVCSKTIDGKTLISTHEDRPNNWGTHAGSSRAAAAVYLGDTTEVKRCTQVLKGWMGDRKSYDGFDFGKRYWQADPDKPVGINPKGAQKNGHSIDGVLPDDQRRGGEFSWPPPKENYVYEALQGVLAQAVILHRQGYDVWNWEDKALLRAFKWLYDQADYPAKKDDTWQPYLINHFYGEDFPVKVPSKPGKNVGFTDWTHPGYD